MTQKETPDAILTAAEINALLRPDFSEIEKAADEYIPQKTTPLGSPRTLCRSFLHYFHTLSADFKSISLLSARSDHPSFDINPFTVFFRAPDNTLSGSLSLDWKTTAFLLETTQGGSPSAALYSTPKQEYTPLEKDLLKHIAATLIHLLSQTTNILFKQTTRPLSFVTKPSILRLETSLGYCYLSLTLSSDIFATGASI